jgi:hypothetical protein
VTPLGASNRVIACLETRRHRQINSKSSKLYHRAEKYRWSLLVLPRPSPWTEAHRSKPPPVPSLKMRSSPSRDRAAASAWLLNPRYGWLPLLHHFLPLGVTPSATQAELGHSSDGATVRHHHDRWTLVVVHCIVRDQEYKPGYPFGWVNPGRRSDRQRFSFNELRWSHGPATVDPVYRPLTYSTGLFFRKIIHKI